jgi:hypothetical protein
MKSYGPPKLWESQLWEFWDSHLGVSGQNDIWALILWPGTKYTIRGKVVASPKSGPWWVLWVRVCPWLIHALKCCNYALTNLLFSLCRFVWINEMLVSFLVPSRSSNTPFYPQSVVSQRACPNSFSFHYLHLCTRSWIHRRTWGASLWDPL